MNRPENEEPGDDAAAGVRRREFLEILAASFAAVSAGGCKIRPPKEKIIPALEQAEETLTGRSSFYASTCSACPASCGVLVECRDGRPIKLEGNPEHPLSRGGLCARGQASVLDLYDAERHRGPAFDGLPFSWTAADAAVSAALARAGKEGRGVMLLSHSVPSPTLRSAIAAFVKRYPSGRHVAYDPVSSSAILESHLLTHGRRVLPRYHLEKAKVIVSFGADFLGTWISPVEFSKDWAANRRPETDFDLMSWHAQFEPRVSLTGSNADLRVALKPSQEFPTLVELGRLVAVKTGWKGPMPPVRKGGAPGFLSETADMLAGDRGRAIVLCGSQDAGAQVVVNWINEMLGAYGATLDLARPSLQLQGDDREMDRAIDELAAGKIGVLFILGANPAADHPRSAQFRAALAKADLSVSLSTRRDETSALVKLVCPDHHALEAWGDAEPQHGVLSLLQPGLSPLFDTRAAVESLAAWSGKPATAYELLRARWSKEVFPLQKAEKDFSSFWDSSVRAGALSLEVKPFPAPVFRPESLSLGGGAAPAGDGRFELVAYPSIALGAGAQANNPWLQELPDPVTKACWGNYASFSPADARRLGLVEGRVVRVEAHGVSVLLPSHIQPGQADGVVAAALGYGRDGAGKIAANYPMRKMFPIDRELLSGADLFPFLRAGAVSVTVTGSMSALAKTQRYDYLVDPLMGERRPHVRETILQDFVRDPRAGNPEPPLEAGLWPEHEYEGHKWAMAIDLNACTGCSACVIACQAENNVPVVGKSEVLKSRDMQWLRLDRYYSGSQAQAEMSPEVVFQPMLCQQCDHAPCETVCPVLATVHSTEGLNMQVYNRCVGTRYCANNCPYKVRRFNWFDYAHDDLLQNLALNPDVTVRSRGVMEKCSFCSQRIYEAKGDAKTAGRTLKDGDVRPACAQSCPADAIVFGDVNDPESRIAKALRGPRAYSVLGDLGVGPSVRYLTKVRNKKVVRP